MISVKCTNADCPATFQVPDEFLGRFVRCKKCHTKFQIANSTTPPASAERIKAAPTSVAPTVFERPSPMQAPPQQEKAPAAKSRLYLYIGGAAAAAAVFCVAITCVAGIGIAYTAFGRSSEIYGGIEISSTTVKASVVKFFPDRDAGFDYEFLSDDEMQVTTNLEKLGPDGNFDPDTFEKTAAAVANFYKDLQSKHSVAPDKIVIVASSGAFKSLDNFRLNANQDKLRSRITADTKRTLEIVSLEQELELQINSLIPNKETDRALLVDLGNSLCRGGGFDTKTKKHTIFNPKIGVKGFQKKAEADAALRGYKQSKRPEQRKLFVDVAAKSVDFHFRDPLVKELNKTSDFNGRKRIELVGGTPWVTATYKNPAGRAKKHTKLTKQDIDDFYMEVRRELNYPPFTMPKGLEPSLTKKLNSDVDFMEQRISFENLIAGTEMLRVLSEELTFQRRDVYFNNNGQKALVLGFMTKMWERGGK